MERRKKKKKTELKEVLLDGGGPGGSTGGGGAKGKGHVEVRSSGLSWAGGGARVGHPLARAAVQMLFQCSTRPNCNKVTGVFYLISLS